MLTQLGEESEEPEEPTRLNCVETVSTVYFASVAYAGYSHLSSLVVYLVDHPVDAYAQPVQMLVSLQLRNASWSRV